MSKNRAQSTPPHQPPHQGNNRDQQQQSHQVPQQPLNGQQKFSLIAIGPKVNDPPDSRIFMTQKRQYRRLVIQYHPDKNQGDQLCRQRFHKFQEAYNILSDPKKKQIYDETGTIGDNFDVRSFQTAYQYFRGLHKRIEESDIEQFAKVYRHGEMEMEDLLHFYQKNQGDVTTLLQAIPLTNNNDIPRLLQFFEDAIAEHKLTRFKMFDKSKSQVKQLPDQTTEFNKLSKEREEDMKDLMIAIKNKPNSSFLDALEQKYAPKKMKATSHTATTQPKKGRGIKKK